eukprot:scaffold78328_cov65-Phaeocystis_antarctica.AAC.2
MSYGRHCRQPPWPRFVRECACRGLLTTLTLTTNPDPDPNPNPMSYGRHCRQPHPQLTIRTSSALQHAQSGLARSELQRPASWLTFVSGPKRRALGAWLPKRGRCGALVPAQRVPPWPSAARGTRALPCHQRPYAQQACHACLLAGAAAENAGAAGGSSRSSSTAGAGASAAAAACSCLRPSRRRSQQRRWTPCWSTAS